MLNSQIQHGTHDSVQSMSSNAIDLEKLKIVVESIEKSVANLAVAPDKQAEILADLSTIKSQSSSPEPKISIIRECMHSIRNIIEGATGSVIAAQLLPQIDALLR